LSGHAKIEARPINGSGEWRELSQGHIAEGEHGGLLPIKLINAYATQGRHIRWS
jgi:hypothetical protein